VCEALINKKEYSPLHWCHLSVERDHQFNAILHITHAASRMMVDAWQRLGITEKKWIFCLSYKRGWKLFITSHVTNTGMMMFRFCHTASQNIHHTWA
jgi:hypothetical protein